MSENHLNSVELFSGAGGLSLGMSKSGFHHEMLVEQNACAIPFVYGRVVHIYPSSGAGTHRVGRAGPLAIGPAENTILL